MSETPGKVRQMVGSTRLYIKPTLGKVIIRKSGVRRVSDKVLARNEAFVRWAGGAGGAVVSCRGKPWPEYIRCLKTEAKELGPGTSKTLAYRKKFWKHPG